MDARMVRLGSLVDGTVQMRHAVITIIQNLQLYRRSKKHLHKRNPNETDTNPGRKPKPKPKQDKSRYAWC